MNGLNIKRNTLSIKISLYWFTAFYLNMDMLEDMIKTAYVLLAHREPFYLLNILFSLIGSGAALCTMLCRKVDIKFITITFSLFALYAVSLLITPEISVILKTSIVRSVIYLLLLLYLMSQISDVGLLFNFFIPYVYLGVLYTLLSYLAHDTPLMEETHYMEFTYNTMIPMLTVFVIAFYGRSVRGMKRPFALLFFGFFFAANIAMGGRATLLCVGLCFLMLLYFQKLKRKQIFVSVAVIALGLVVAFHYDSFNFFLTTLFPDSRTVQRMQNGELLNTETSTRMRIYKYILLSFMEHPFAIRGLLSDRVYIAKLFGDTAPKEVYGWYAHNFVLELLFQFGVMAIPIITAFLCGFVNTAANVKKSNNTSLKRVFLISSAYCIGQLSVSASYLTAKSFAFLLGILLYMGKPEKRRAYENSARL